MADKQPEYLTIAEAAARLRLTEQHVRRLAAKGVIAGQKKGRDWALNPESVERLLAERETLRLPLRGTRPRKRRRK